MVKPNVNSNTAVNSCVHIVHTYIVVDNLICVFPVF